MDRSWQAAREGGILFYDPPTTDMPSVDPLIRPICERINTSGWVWTAESCQGHPDKESGMAAWNYVAPYLRLGVRTEDLGEMMGRLLLCTQYGSAGGIQSVPFEVYSRRKPTLDPNGNFPNDGGEHHGKWKIETTWMEISLIFKGCNLYDRRMALEALQRFADALCNIR